MSDFPAAVFFDLDETLLSNTLSAEQLITELAADQFPSFDTERTSCFLQLLIKHVTPLWNEVLSQDLHSGEGLVNCFQRTLVDLGEERFNAEAVYAAFIKFSASNTQLNDYALEVIATLKHNNCKIGIITNGFEAMQLAKIRHHDLDKLVDTVVVSEQAGAHKPDKKVFNYALDRLQVSAQQAWHIGDHIDNDVAGAINAGMTAVHYDPEKVGSSEGSVKPHKVIHHFSELFV